MRTKLLQTIRKHTVLSKELEQKITNLTTTHKVAKGRQLILPPSDIAFVETGLLKKVHKTTEKVCHFIGENDFIIIPRKEENHEFIAIEKSALISCSIDDFTSITAANKQLSEAHHKLMLYWSVTRNIRAELLILSAAERKEKFPKYFKGMANRLSNTDIASYLDINNSYYSSL